MAGRKTERCTGVRCGFCVTGFFANVRGDGATDDAQGFAHDGRFVRE